MELILRYELTKKKYLETYITETNEWHKYNFK